MYKRMQKASGRKWNSPMILLRNRSTEKMYRKIRRDTIQRMKAAINLIEYSKTFQTPSKKLFYLNSFMTSFHILLRLLAFLSLFTFLPFFFYVGLLAFSGCFLFFQSFSHEPLSFNIILAVLFVYASDFNGPKSAYNYILTFQLLFSPLRFSFFSLDGEEFAFLGQMAMSKINTIKIFISFISSIKFIQKKLFILLTQFMQFDENNSQLCFQKYLKQRLYLYKQEFEMNMKQSNAHYKNFKKKNSNMAIEIPKEKEKNSDRFGDLRCKLQKQKESMKKTGRRFRQEHSVSTQAISIEIGTQQPKQKNENSKSCEISIGPDAPIKQTISLSDIGTIQNQQDAQSIMRSSKVFEREVKYQKKRNDELQKFLQSIGMEKFCQGLISSGYDDLETLSEITVEDLNHLMMRAQQQDRLLEALKKMNLRQQKQQQTMNRSSVSTSGRWRVKTEATGRATPIVESSRRKKTETIQILERIKTERDEKDKISAKSQLQMRGSFLYTVGSRNWGVEDQIRRACSSCFRVEKQMQKKGDCYYCSNCYKYVAEDLLTIELNTSMDRSYRGYKK